MDSSLDFLLRRDVISRPSSSQRISADELDRTQADTCFTEAPHHNMAASGVSHSPAAPAYRLRHLPLTRRFILPATPRLHLPTGTLYPAARISRCADAPTQLRSNRRHLSQPLAMAYEGSPATTAAKGKQGLLVFDSEEELSVSLAKYTAELSEKFVQERGVFTVVLSGGSLVKSLRFGAELVVSFGFLGF
ncbi:hypothetical protein GW17_00018218 [Ensete ventricosum]|nr:hypothetical protein GW17_00018218 [Ensete ventricosum]